MIQDSLHLEITTKCTLKCPECPRTIYAGQYAIQDLPLAQIENAISHMSPFRQIFLCGDHGDPIYHSQFHEVLRLIQQRAPDKPIVVATNGSHRSKEWWEATAQLCRPQDVFTFGVDGLEEDFHLYRRGGDWQSLSQGLEILKSQSQVQIFWQWILFRHNEKSLSRAKAQAQAWGVDKFLLVQSHRDHSPESQPTLSLQQAREVFANG